MFALLLALPALASGPTCAPEAPARGMWEAAQRQQAAAESPADRARRAENIAFLEDIHATRCNGGAYCARILARIGELYLEDARAACFGAVPDAAAARARWTAAGVVFGRVREDFGAHAPQPMTGLGLATVAWWDGDPAAAEAALAAAWPPGSPDPPTADALLLCGDLARLVGDEARARDLYQRAIAASAPPP